MLSCFDFVCYNIFGGDVMTKHYEQRKAANERYLATLDSLLLRLPKGKKDEIKVHAESCGESVNGFISRAIAETMMRDKESDPKPGGNESQGDVL